MAIPPKSVPRERITATKLLDREKKLSRKTRHIMRVSVSMSEVEYERLLKFAEELPDSLSNTARLCLFRGLTDLERFGAPEAQPIEHRQLERPT